MNPAHLPATTPIACAWALKEWAGILQAIRAGRQAILLRKGGIAEPAQRFLPDQAPRFWLYPTHTHQAQQGILPPFATAQSITLPAATPATVSQTNSIPINLVCRLLAHWFIDQESTLPLLAHLHAWTPETIHHRFHYRRPGLHLLLLETHARTTPHLITETPQYAGCKSWVELVPPLTLDHLTPIPTQTPLPTLQAELDHLLGSPASRTEPAPHG